MTKPDALTPAQMRHHPPLIATMLDQRTGREVKVQIRIQSNAIRLFPLNDDYPAAMLRVQDGQIRATIRSDRDIHSDKRFFVCDLADND